jgi:hypothetical protein
MHMQMVTLVCYHQHQLKATEFISWTSCSFQFKLSLLPCQGNSAFKRRQWSKAVQFYSEAISLSDTNATYYCNRAAAYLELGRYTCYQPYFSALSFFLNQYVKSGICNLMQF